MREFTAADVLDVFSTFRRFDLDNDGYVDRFALLALDVVLARRVGGSSLAQCSRDGRVDAKQFFSYYVGVQPEAAHAALDKHAHLFDELHGQPLREWSVEYVRDAMRLFHRAANGDAVIHGKPTDLLPPSRESRSPIPATALRRDGQIGPRDFFAYAPHRAGVAR